MTVDKNTGAVFDDSPKSIVDHIDVVEFEKPEQKRDYAGAAAKTDPEEIRLVRKLDYRILPILFVMYFLNYVDSEWILDPVLGETIGWVLTRIIFQEMQLLRRSLMVLRQNSKWMETSSILLCRFSLLAMY